MKVIKGFEGLYSITPSGDVYSHRSCRLLKRYNHPSGYKFTALHKDGKRHQRLIHRVVAAAYIPNPDNLPTVNHKDGDKTNNKVSNLEWMSYRDNNLHALETGLNNPANRRAFSDEEAHTICKMLMDGWRQKDIVDSLGLDRSSVKQVRYSGYYEHVTSEYDWSKCPTRSTKVSVESAIKVCELLQEGDSYQSIHQKTEVSVRNIKNIKYRVTFKSISDSFTF